MPDVIAKHAFTMEDQEAFACMSGDRNPMHLDVAEARQTQAGGPVVHGMHILLWAMECLVRKGFDLGRLTGGRAKFVSFVPVGQTVTLSVVKSVESTLQIEVGRDDGTAMTARLDFAVAGAVRAARTDSADAVPTVPCNPEFARIAGTSGRLLAPVDAKQRARAMFPAATRALGTATVGDFASMSALVGMVVPGLHSIISEITFHNFDAAAHEQILSFTVVRTDERFRLVEIEIEGAHVAGRVTAFARLPPPPAPDVRAALSVVSPNEFRTRRALVVGGSRGLGAATSVLLAAGGASVTLSYREGRNEAKKLAGEIGDLCGKERCAVIAYDASTPAVKQISRDGPGFTHAYYFATPRIFAGGKVVYSRTRLGEFFSIYVDGFFDLITTLLRAQAPAPLSALYPSSVAVVDRPRQMTEYAMAKAAGEILCADMERTFPGLTISVPRLPRIATGQTATVPPVFAADPIAIMLPLLREGSPAFERPGTGAE